jgi:hypothetical protein
MCVEIHVDAQGTVEALMLARMPLFCGAHPSLCWHHLAERVACMHVYWGLCNTDARAAISDTHVQPSLTRTCRAHHTTTQKFVPRYEQYERERFLPRMEQYFGLIDDSHMEELVAKLRGNLMQGVKAQRLSALMSMMRHYERGHYGGTSGGNVSAGEAHGRDPSQMMLNRALRKGSTMSLRDVMTKRDASYRKSAAVDGWSAHMDAGGWMAGELLTTDDMVLELQVPDRPEVCVFAPCNMHI